MISSIIGLIMCFVSVLFILFIIIRKWIMGDPVAGWPSMACIVVFIGGLELFCMGIMGQYIAKTYLETKHRPHYIVAESNRDDVKKIR